MAFCTGMSYLFMINIQFTTSMSLLSVSFHPVLATSLSTPWQFCIYFSIHYRCAVFRLPHHVAVCDISVSLVVGLGYCLSLLDYTSTSALASHSSLPLLRDFLLLPMFYHIRHGLTTALWAFPFNFTGIPGRTTLY